eukprot:1538719-Pyramimonas_sp.AAC.1
MEGLVTVSSAIRGKAKRMWHNSSSVQSAPSSPAVVHPAPSSISWFTSLRLTREFPSAWQDWVPMRTPFDDRAFGGAQCMSTR